ncbi:hypothetical protein SEVIR_4G055300v4 [Setaria viridis]|uniref:Uncharacterized protein n=1 Tax=Setaria viridis TaxID=4556 RepID=A0A4U6UXB2_SETVI|nr:hypothetical protein SEVIR_4G055300v2 [Setaria viridis]
MELLAAGLRRPELLTGGCGAQGGEKKRNRGRARPAAQFPQQCFLSGRCLACSLDVPLSVLLRVGRPREVRAGDRPEVWRAEQLREGPRHQQFSIALARSSGPAAARLVAPGQLAARSPVRRPPSRQREGGLERRKKRMEENRGRDNTGRKIEFNAGPLHETMGWMP